MLCIQLRLGRILPADDLQVIWGALIDLDKDHPRAFRELVLKARLPNHKVTAVSDKILRERSLLEVDGDMKNITRDVILSVVQGDTAYLRLVNPFSPKNQIPVSIEPA